MEHDFTPVKQREDDALIAPDQIGPSAYRAHAWALTGKSPVEWEKLGDAEQHKWLKHAVDFSAHAAGMEGVPVVDACKRLLPGFEKLTPREQLAFQAAVRHMAMLIDAFDQIGDLSGQEAFWKGWTEERLKRLPAAPPAAPILQPKEVKHEQESNDRRDDFGPDQSAGKRGDGGHRDMVASWGPLFDSVAGSRDEDRR